MQMAGHGFGLAEKNNALEARLIALPLQQLCSHLAASADEMSRKGIKKTPSHNILFITISHVILLRDLITIMSVLQVAPWGNSIPRGTRGEEKKRENKAQPLSTSALTRMPDWAHYWPHIYSLLFMQI
jgi:hypothetical protein